MDLKTQISTFFSDIKGTLQIITPIVAFIGLTGAGIIYMGSSWPIISKLKRDNPDMMNNMAVGLAVIFAASTLASLVVYS